MNNTRCPLCGGSVAYGTQEDQGTSHCMKCGFWFVTDTEGDITDAIESARKEALAERDAAIAELAALKKRLADSPIGALERAKQSALHVPQTPDTGLGAVIGKWPGTETDEEVADYFDCDTPTIRDAAKLAAQHALEIWRKGEKA